MRRAPDAAVDLGGVFAVRGAAMALAATGPIFLLGSSHGRATELAPKATLLTASTERADVELDEDVDCCCCNAGCGPQAPLRIGCAIRSKTCFTSSGDRCCTDACTDWL